MPIFVSASALTDFISCETKLYYRIFEKGVSVPSKEMMMGTISHKVLETEWNNKDSALELGNTLCDKIGLDEVSKNSVQHFIHTYFDSFRFMVKDSDSIEKKFKVKLYDDVFLVGVFDRISEGIVIDWKTTASPPKKLDNNVQFIVYNLAYNMVYGKNPKGLYLAALKDGSLIRYNESKQHADTLIKQIIPEFVQHVKQRQFSKNGLFNGSCYRCQYKAWCLSGEDNELVG